MSISGAPARQRLLYIHAKNPSVMSGVIAMTTIEPTEGFRLEIDAEQIDEWPYETVHAAIVDGWQVVQFPMQQAAYDDRDIDVVGYEFVLQKMEAVE